MSFTFSTTKSLVCAPDASKDIGQHCRALGINKVLIVTDPGLTDIGLHSGIISALESTLIPAVLFNKVQMDPPSSTINQAVDFAKSQDIDGVIGLGGGSSLDTAKLIAVLVGSSQTLDDIYGIDKITSNRLPLIQIPTTAGTGSEVTPISIVTTEDSQKLGIVSSVLLPDIALLDPVLTLGLPPHITAATGVDAMVHAIEAYTSVHKKNPYSDMLAKQALSLMTSAITDAVFDGGNLKARSDMMLGATLAGQAFANAPVAAVHALAYPLGGHYHIPHGLSNALVLPHVLRFNHIAAFERYAELYDTIAMPTSLSAEQKSEAFITYFENLLPKLGLPNKLREVNVPESDLEMLAADGMKQQRLLINNPREMTEQDILTVYQQAY